MSLYWLREGWTDAVCPRCGRKIWPEGDPDWGLCFECFSQELEERRAYEREPAQEAPDVDVG